MSIAIDPTGRFVFLVINSGGGGVEELDEFAIDSSTGALTAFPHGFFVGSDPRSVTADPFGHFIFTSDNTTSMINELLLDPFGNVSGGFAAPAFAAQSLRVDPSGQYLYAVDQNNDVTGFSIGAFGRLTAIPGLPTRMPGAWALTVTGTVH